MAAFVSRDPSDRDAFLKHWRRILGDPSKTMKPQVTYWLGKQYWGQGIASRALAEFVRDLKTRPLYASAAADNAASIRVLQKCGFTICGSAKARSPVRAGKRSKK